MKTNYFDNVGYLSHHFTDDELRPLLDEVEEITKVVKESNGDRSKVEEQYVTMNKVTVGNLYAPVMLTESRNSIFELLKPLVVKFDSDFKYFESIPEIQSINLSLEMGPVWVNYQNKYEFHPQHIHASVLSFVIFLDIPYTNEEEMKANPSPDTNKNATGCFEFAYTDSLGMIRQHLLRADKNWNNTVLLFPSRMNHTVYPFFSSDRKRISVAGNLILLPQQFDFPPPDLPYTEHTQTENTTTE
jgi:hypothetical protein